MQTSLLLDETKYEKNNKALIFFRQKMEITDPGGARPLRARGREAESETHARLPPLQVPSTQEKEGGNLREHQLARGLGEWWAWVIRTRWVQGRV